MTVSYLKKCVPILNLSLKTIRMLYISYLEGVFIDVSLFKSGPEKKKDTSFVKNIIAYEIGLNPCIGVKILGNKLETCTNLSSNSAQRPCSIIKTMNYTRKPLL